MFSATRNLANLASRRCVSASVTRASGLAAAKTQTSTYYTTPAVKNAADSFLSGSNSVYIDTMYDSWKTDPKSVHVSWQAYFAQMEAGAQSGAYVAPPTITGTRKICT